MEEKQRAPSIKSIPDDEENGLNIFHSNEVSQEELCPTSSRPINRQRQINLAQQQYRYGHSMQIPNPKNEFAASPIINSSNLGVVQRLPSGSIYPANEIVESADLEHNSSHLSSLSDRTQQEVIRRKTHKQSNKLKM